MLCVPFGVELCPQLFGWREKSRDSCQTRADLYGIVFNRFEPMREIEGYGVWRKAVESLVNVMAQASPTDIFFCSSLACLFRIGISVHCVSVDAVPTAFIKLLKEGVAQA